MKLITIFNYKPSKYYINLCNWWLKQAKEHNPGLDIEVWYDKEKIVEDPDIRFVKMDGVNIEHVLAPELVDDKSRHNIGFKLYNLCNETEPFIFIDADAIIFHSLQTLVDASKDQDFIAVDHQNIPGHTDFISFKFLNSGVQVCSDPSILDFDAIIQLLQRERRFYCPGTDQAALFMYLSFLGYDYHHPDVGFEWNSCAQYTKVIDGELECRGLDIRHPVYINHYWYKFKPWDIKCPLYEQYIRGFNEENITDR